MLSLKGIAQGALKQIRLYERVKASFLYDLYWRVADKKIIDGRDREVNFYQNLLCGFRQGDLVFDIGANEGFKTDIFLRLGATVIAVDPDTTNQAVLRGRFLQYRMIKKPVVIVGKAVSDKDGVDTLWVDEPGSAKNTLNRKWVQILREDRHRFGKTSQFEERMPVETITLETLISTYGVPFFIKIDTEGHERSVLSGLNRPVPYLSFEVNLPEFMEEGMQCLDLLDRLERNGRFNYVVDSEPLLAGERWVNSREFREVLSNCSGDSIDVFWKTVE
jgi:FkbM family methyltransferase